MTTRKYTYSATVITSIIAANGAELMAFPGATLELDPESERVKSLVAQGHLVAEGEVPAATVAESTEEASPPTTQSPGPRRPRATGAPPASRPPASKRSKKGT